VEITQVGSKTTQVLSSTGIPVLAFRKKEEDERHFLEFNPLVENAIKCQRFRLMNYEWLMAMGHPLSRWLYRKLCQPNTDADDSSSVTMTAMEIAENGGIAPRSRPRDTLRFVAKAVDGLVDIGLLEPVQRQTERQGRKNTDIVFDLVPTPKFLADLRKAERVSSDGRARMKQVAGTDRPESFVPVERQVAVRARAERRKLFRADAPEGAAA
jgi:hypothetical protein